jgi:DsbC/DsbD-like thiol-disulfide interchange protein
MRPFLLLGLWLAAASPVLAGATPWHDVAPGARLRLISSDVRNPDGTTLVGLELDMPDSFKTYWRVPGESGIPTRFDTTGSRGVGLATIAWPYPTPELTQNLLDYVYHGLTVLPVTIVADGPAPLLKAAVVMGVCSEVCVPVRAKFELPLSFAVADDAQSIRLREAAALAPIGWTGATPPFSGVAYDAAAQALELAITDPAVEPASIIASTADPAVIFGAPQKSRDGQAILLPLRGKDVGTGWTAQPVDLTFMTSMGAFVVSERIAPAP